MPCGKSSPDQQLDAPVAGSIPSVHRSQDQRQGTAPTSNGSVVPAVGLPMARQAAATTLASLLYSHASSQGRHSSLKSAARQQCCGAHSNVGAASTNEGGQPSLES